MSKQQESLQEEKSLLEQEQEAQKEKEEFIEKCKIVPPTIEITYINIGGTRDSRYGFDISHRVGVTGTDLGEPSIYRTIDRLQHVGSPIKLNVVTKMKKDSNDINEKDIDEICKEIQKDKTGKIIINGGLDRAIYIMKKIEKRLKGIKKTIVYGGSNGSFYSNRKAVFVDHGLELGAVQVYPYGFYLATNLAVFQLKNVKRNIFIAPENTMVNRSIFSRKDTIADESGKLLNIPEFVVEDFGGTFGKMLENSAYHKEQEYVYPVIGTIETLFNEILKKFGVSILLKGSVVIGKRIDSMLSDQKYREKALSIIKAVSSTNHLISHGTDSMVNMMKEVYQKGERNRNYIFLGSCTPLSEEETTDGYHSVGSAFAILSYLEGIASGEIAVRPSSNVWLSMGGFVMSYNEDIIKDNEGRFIRTSKEVHDNYVLLNDKHLCLYKQNLKK